MNWICAGNGQYKKACKRVALARTAVGSGHLEEQLIRLMVWCGATTENCSEHSKIEFPPAILEDGRAWCDQQCKIFGYLSLHFFGLPSRLVAMTDTTGQGHTVVEVHYDGLWHLFDVHEDHQTVYRSSVGRILSYMELRQQPEIVEAVDHWWRANGIGKVDLYRGSVRYYNYSLQQWPWAWSLKP